MIWILGFLMAQAGNAGADVSAPAAAPPPAAKMEALALDLTCILPAAGPAVERGVLVVRLHEYDPRLADGAANEICRISLTGISHRAGEETVLRFPCNGQTPMRKAYYLTAVLYPEGAAADSAGVYFIDGFQRVLTAANREALSVTLTPVEGEGEPTN